MIASGAVFWAIICIDWVISARVYEQHFVRIAAYCYLTEISQGRQSPYGIVLTRGTLTGIAIPKTKATREQFVAAMANARKVIQH